MISLSIFSFLCLHFALVDAALFTIEPFQNSTCSGGKPCVVTWVDDGQQPLLQAMGISTVALCTMTQQLVQTITPVDVALASELTFTPFPDAGPDSDDYYITFTSTEFNTTDGSPYMAYSAFFGLRDMSGSFDSPLPAATSSIPIPQSLKDQPTSSSTNTVTIGTLPTSPRLYTSSPLPTSSVTSTSGSSGSQTAVSISTSSTSLPTTPTPTPNGSSNHHSRPLPVLLLALLIPALFVY